MPGIVTTHSIDKEYFKVGEAYRICVSTNEYRNSILTQVTDDSVTFKYIESGGIHNLTLGLNQLMYRNSYNITKLKPDYEDGVFKYDIQKG